MQLRDIAKDATCVQSSTSRVHKLKKQHFKVPAQPMEFISMDLIGEFHPPSSKGNRYALTAICMLTGFTFCIPLKSKTAKDVVDSIHGQYLLRVWSFKKDSDRQWHRVQK